MGDALTRLKALRDSGVLRTGKPVEGLNDVVADALAEAAEGTTTDALPKNEILGKEQARQLVLGQIGHDMPPDIYAHAVRLYEESAARSVGPVMKYLGRGPYRDGTDIHAGLSYLARTVTRRISEEGYDRAGP